MSRSMAIPASTIRTAFALVARSLSASADRGFWSILRTFLIRDARSRFPAQLSQIGGANKIDILEHFPGRSNREGFPRRHESDSRFPAGARGPVMNGEAI